MDQGKKYIAIAEKNNTFFDDRLYLVNEIKKQNDIQNRNIKDVEKLMNMEHHSLDYDFNLAKEFEKLRQVFKAKRLKRKGEIQTNV